MSFGWSVGDLIVAIGLLVKISNALQDVGGASSDYQDTVEFLSTLQLTLEHLKLLNALAIKPRIAENLVQQCDHIRIPLEAFLDDVIHSFDLSLGSLSQRTRLLAAPRKLQWALYTSKKSTRLRERIVVPIAAVNMLLGLQTIDSVLQMPQHLQTSISATIDSSLRDAMDTHHHNYVALQNVIAGRIIENNGLYNGKTTQAIQTLQVENRDASSSLHVKLEQIGSGVASIHQQLRGLPQQRQNLLTASLHNEVHQAVAESFGCLLLLVSSLQHLVKAILHLLTPYFVAAYKSSIQPLMLMGDQFLFEDALGRVTRLPCDQFQNWKLFYLFLTDSFANSPGLKHVLERNFRIMNGYNNAIVDQQYWEATIQPKARIVMSMLFKQRQSAARCPLPECVGQIIPDKTKVAGTCSACRRSVIVLPRQAIQTTNLQDHQNTTADAQRRLRSTTDGSMHGRDVPNPVDYSPIMTSAAHYPQHLKELRRREMTVNGEGIDTTMKGELPRTNNEIAVFKRIALLPIEVKKRMRLVQEGDVGLFRSLLRSWAPRPDSPNTPVELLLDIQGVNLLSQFFDILTLHGSGNTTIFGCSVELAKLFKQHAHIAKELEAGFYTRQATFPAGRNPAP